MSPLRRIASSRHRRHVLLPINRRPLLLSTAVAIDLAAIAALPSPSTATPFSTVPLPPAPPASAAPFSSESPHVDLLRATSDPVPISSASPSGNLLLGWWLFVLQSIVLYFDYLLEWLEARSVYKTVACAKGIRMPAKGFSVFRCDIEADARR
ncbi:Os03g0627701 [Oryza sativa Japonica Group]|uniref:Os03g0627701 protein n=1 Tax=Oryza sativa subsp. japonica TaxID=39947 RepID=A0A0P0W142_ORYSJ|nr:Os03g0627701 [Oryza sativa Japonica Group]